MKFYDMPIILALLLGLLPAIFLLWGDSRIRISSIEDHRNACWLRSLPGILAILITILVFTTPWERGSISFLWIVFIPVTASVLALIVILFFSARSVWAGNKLRTLLLLLIDLSLLILLGIISGLTTPLYIIIGGVFVAAVWKIWNWIGKKFLLVWGVQMILLCVSIWAADANTKLIESPIWLSSIVQLAVFALIPAMGITVAAGIVYDLLTRSQTLDWRRVIFTSSLIVSILFLIGYQIYLASVWDVATDGLGGIFLWMIVSIAAIVIAVVMAWFLPGKHRLIMLIFAVLVPLSMQSALWLGSHSPNGQWGESPSYITERRAERIAHAIQGYYEDHGSYPQFLSDLFPWNLIYTPRPIMILGLTWCYEGGRDFYRFGYVYRQYFSTPASVKIHASSGEPPDPYWPCDDDAAKYPPPPGYYNP